MHFSTTARDSVGLGLCELVLFPQDLMAPSMYKKGMKIKGSLVRTVKQWDQFQIKDVHFSLKLGGRISAMVISAQSVMFGTVLLFSDGDKGAMRLEVCFYIHVQNAAAMYLPCTFCSVLKLCPV